MLEIEELGKGHCLATSPMNHFPHFSSSRTPTHTQLTGYRLSLQEQMEKGTISVFESRFIKAVRNCRKPAYKEIIQKCFFVEAFKLKGAKLIFYLANQ